MVESVETILRKRAECAERGHGKIHFVGVEHKRGDYYLVKQCEFCNAELRVGISVERYRSILLSKSKY